MTEKNLSLFTDPLFKDIKFYVPPYLEDGAGLRDILCENGAHISEQPGEDVVYIHDSFERENELFSQLCACGTRIVSPRYIKESIKCCKPLPEITHPLFARFMEETTICLEKCADMDEIRTWTMYMGGRLDESVTDMTDHLIASKVGSIQYQLARHRRIPILSPDWIRECWRSESLQPVTAFLLRPFAGCIISVTGLSASTRNEIQRLVKAYGGEYTPNLTKRCTHLISQLPQGIKYRYALEWGIHCVSVHWLFDSINSQVCGDETQYFLPMSEATRQALFNPLFTSTRDFNRLSPALREKHLMQLHRRTGYSSQLRTPPEKELYFMKGSTIDVKSEDEEEDFDESATLTNFSSNPASSLVSPRQKLKKFTDDNMDMEDTDLQDTEGSNSELEITQIQNLLDLCNQTIDHYKELAKTVDLSPLVNFITKSSRETRIK